MYGGKRNRARPFSKTDLAELPSERREPKCCNPTAPWIRNARHQWEEDSAERHSHVVFTRAGLNDDMRSALIKDPRNQELWDLGSHDRSVAVGLNPHRWTSVVKGRPVQACLFE